MRGCADEGASKRPGARGVVFGWVDRCTLAIGQFSGSVFALGLVLVLIPTARRISARDSLIVWTSFSRCANWMFWPYTSVNCNIVFHICTYVRRLDCIAGKRWIRLLG